MERKRLLPFLLRRKMNTVTYCYISETYYQDYPDLIQILDVNDSSKYNIRTHICLQIKYNNHNILVPLRKQLPDPVRKYGRIGHSVPSQSKPNAGLDYRYIMIIKDDKYIRYDNPRIPNSQQNIIANEYTKIEQEALEYIKTYIKVAKKNRVQKTARFRASSLINFHKELGLPNNVDMFQEQES
jgi:protein AbiQ